MAYLTSCTKEVNIDLNSSNPELIIQGNITDQIGPYYIKLNKTINLNSANNYPPATGALVIIADNFGLIDTLIETTQGIYETNSFVGITGHTYTLKVFFNGKEYNAFSTMPAKVNLDSLSIIPTLYNSYAVIPKYTDPPTIGNNYRFLQTINSQLDFTIFLRNDNEGNGVINQEPIINYDLDILLGDTVNIEMRNVDATYHNYFYELSQFKGGVPPGGGTTPTNPTNNFTINKALGYFGAYTTQTKTIIIQ